MKINSLCALFEKHKISYSIVFRPWLEYDHVETWYLEDNKEINRLVQNKRLQGVYLRAVIGEAAYNSIADAWEYYPNADEIVAKYHHELEWYILVD